MEQRVPVKSILYIEKTVRFLNNYISFFLFLGITLGTVQAQTLVNGPLTFEDAAEGDLYVDPSGQYYIGKEDGKLIPLSPANETVSTLVQNPDGSYTYTDENGTETTFSTASFPTQIVSSVSPSSCLELGQTYDLTITGDHFDGSAQVTITSQTVNFVNVISATQIQANVTITSASNSDVSVMQHGRTVTHTNAISGTTVTPHALTVGDLSLFRTTYTGNVLRAIHSNWWSQRAYTLTEKIDNGVRGYLEFTYDAEFTTINYVVGLDKAPSDTEFWPDFGFYMISPTNVRVSENGTNRFTTTVVDGDVLRIEVDCDDIVRYYKNNVLLYTSNTVRSTDLFFLASLNSSVRGVVRDIILAY